jgi:hypothetical protein
VEHAGHEAEVHVLVVYDEDVGGGAEKLQAFGAAKQRLRAGHESLQGLFE